VVLHGYNPSYTGVIGIGPGQPRQKVWDSIWKITKAKRSGGMAQVVPEFKTPVPIHNSQVMETAKMPHHWWMD
jgi:hypothetical protein